MTKARELSQLGDKITIDDTTGDFSVDTDTLYVDVSADRVGIGTSSPDTTLVVEESAVTQTAQGNDIAVLKRNADGYIKVYSPNTGIGGIAFGDTDDPFTGAIRYQHSTDHLDFYVNNSERFRVDATGNMLVGKTTSSGSVEGAELRANGRVFATADGTEPLFINRLSSDGKLITLRQASTEVGSIDARSGSNNISINSVSNSGRLSCGGNEIYGWNLSQFWPVDDNLRDLGVASDRWDDVYATNGTIQTSDENEKQQIASLTDAEITAAKAISKLFKTFKWNDSVAEKGDAARTHTGVIAQEVEQAMTDAGLNAGDYAFWCSNTWWETQTEVPAVEADEENGVEAKEAYTRTDTYDTAEEAPEGATERNRKGIRYPQLLSFIGAATEQRLASIESRLDALESA